MPVYTYHCDNCDNEFEKYQSFSEESLTTCPKCGEDELRKVYTPALVVFKGSGFYVTDTKSANSTLTSNNHKENSQDESPAEKPKAEPKAKKGSDTKGKKTEKN